MPIKVACKCGQKFAAKDELAGKAVKCPKCKQPLRIPGGKQAPSKPAAPKQAPGTPQKPAAPQSPAGLGGGGGMDDLFNDLTVEQSVTGTGNVCPNCLEGIAQNAVVCVHCGFRMDDGERLETEKGSEKVKRGHQKLESFGNAQLDQAAVNIEKDKRDSELEDDQGAWWVYLMGIFVIIAMAIIAFASTSDTVFGDATSGGDLTAEQYEELDRYLQTHPGVSREEAEKVVRYGESGNSAHYISFAGYGGLVMGTAGLMIFYVWVATMIVSFKREENKVHGILNAVLCNIYPVFYLGLRTTHYPNLFELLVASQNMYLLGLMCLNAIAAAQAGLGWASMGLLVVAVFTVMGSVKVMLNWGTIATHAYEEEESLLHAILCCVLGGLWAIVYGIMRWSKLRIPVMQIFMGVFLSLLPWGVALTFLLGSLMFSREVEAMWLKALAGLGASVVVVVMGVIYGVIKAFSRE